jgi:hypothetical protein
MITKPGETFVATAPSAGLVPPPLLGSGTALLGAGAGTAGMALLLGCGDAEVLAAG